MIGSLGVEELSSVGDVNGDGYDDAVVGWRERTLVNDDCIGLFGPAELFLGGPEGLQSEPLWELFATGHPESGVGRYAVPFPKEDTLVLSMVQEGGWCKDWSPAFLAVVRQAGTADAYVESVIEVPALDPEGYMPEIRGWAYDPLGQPSVLVYEADGSPQGVQWLPWLGADGLAAKSSAVWAPDWLEFGSLWHLTNQPEREVQGLVRRHTPPGTVTAYDELLVWGRGPEEVGPSHEGSTADGVCTFWARSLSEPGPEPPPPPPNGTSPGSSTGWANDITIPGEEVIQSPSCGCRQGGTPVLPLLLAAILPWRRVRGSHSRAEGPRTSEDAGT